MGEQVIGHYVPAGKEGEGWQAALAQSTDLFKALVADDLTAFQRHLAASASSEHSSSSSSWHTVLFWSAANPEQQNEAKVEAKSRTLAMLATQHGSMRVLAYLLSKGSCPTEKTKDGADCFTVSSADSCTAGLYGIIMGTRALRLFTHIHIVLVINSSRRNAAACEDQPTTAVIRDTRQSAAPFSQS